jgi:hypothetical protein
MKQVGLIVAINMLIQASLFSFISEKADLDVQNSIFGDMRRFRCIS